MNALQTLTAAPTNAGAIITIATTAACVGLLWRAKAIRGTTLIAPWIWCLLAICLLAAVELLIAWFRMGETSKSALPTGMRLLRQVAAAATVCPAMSLLGAKRPQDRGWQFVVASLWLVLCLPTAQAALFSSRSILFDTIWSLFLAVILLAGFANHVVTRYWLAATFVLAGQILLLGPRLPGVNFLMTEALPLPGMLLLIMAIGCVRLWPPRKITPGWNCVWLDWRDAFGLLWGLRVGDRFNSTAKHQQWNRVLRWSGFQPSGDDSTGSEELPLHASRSFRMLLRRFVPREWVDRRLEE